jgi:hypothetical protein
MIMFGAALVVLYPVFWAWHSPWAGKLTKAEIDRYLAIIERSLQPAEEIEAFASRVRSWAEADNGRPVYMSISCISSHSSAPSRRSGVQGNITES